MTKAKDKDADVEYSDVDTYTNGVADPGTPTDRMLKAHADEPEVGAPAQTITTAVSGNPEDNAGVRGDFEHNGATESKPLPGTNITTNVLVAPERAGDEGVVIDRDVYKTVPLVGSKTATTQVLVHKAGTRLYGDDAAAYAEGDKETKRKK